MLNKKYNAMIQAHIEDKFDRILPIGTIGAILSVMIVFNSSIDNKYAIIIGVVGLSFLIVFTLKKQISAECKMCIAIIFPMVMGGLVFLDGRFYNGGMYLLLISNIVAVMLLSRVNSIIISTITTAIYIINGVYTTLFPINYSSVDMKSSFSIQTIVFLLLLINLHTLVYSIRDYLLKNIKRLEKTVEKTHQLAYYDQLTGLPNQHLFMNKLSKEIDKKACCGLIAIFKIKNLNMINSIYGEDFGNRVLLKCAKVFNDSSREEQVLSRVNGNEFALWAPNIYEGELKGQIHGIKESLKSLQISNGVEKEIEVYSGYAYYRIEMNSIFDCYKKAHIALTYAKDRNAQEVISYNESFETSLLKHEKVKDLVKIALKNKEFLVYYQSQVNTKKNEVVGVEALARWESTDLGFVSPSVFIPIIEELNLVVQFGELILSQVLEDYERIRQKYGDDISISVNISASHLTSGKLIPFLEERFSACNLTPKLVLEITESVIINGIDEVENIINRLHQLGIMISIDDFGTGYSSLNYLTRLDVDEVKIDKSFIDQLNKKDKVKFLIESIIHLSTKMNFKIVAEGVETLEDSGMLMKLGCKLVQGYYYSMPEPLSKRASSLIKDSLIMDTNVILDEKRA